MSGSITPSGPAAAPEPARDLDAIVREKLMAGELPRGEEAGLVLNLGLVSPCDVCGAPISYVEYLAELHDGRKLRLHGACMEAWQRARGDGGERARFEVPHPDWEGHSADVLCAACGLRIPPFDGRFVLKGVSLHPRCYEQTRRVDGRGGSGP